MSMLFPAVKDALITLLGVNASGRFSVEGYQRQSHGAEEMVGQLRHVTVYYAGGQFDKSKSGWSQGPFRHDMRFRVELTLAAPARMDLSTIDDPNASPQARQSALAASIEAAANADALWDELAGIIWAILLDPRNQDLGGLAIAERWIASTQKENPAPRGEFVLLSGSMDYTCSGNERPPGEVGVPAGAGAIDITLTETADITGAGVDSAAQGAKTP